jgi:hypothetical protein
MSDKLPKKNVLIRMNAASKQEPLYALRRQSSDEGLEEKSTNGGASCIKRAPPSPVPERQEESTLAKKRVSFALQAKARRVSSWRNYSPAELYATWYTPEEYKEILQGCCREIIKLERGEECCCPRGLESQTKFGRSTRNRRKFESTKAVIEEQDAQRGDEEEEHVFCGEDEEAIAFVYRQVTASCQLRASATGLADWHAVQEYYLEDTPSLNGPASPPAFVAGTAPATTSTEKLDMPTTKLPPSAFNRHCKKYATMA